MQEPEIKSPQDGSSATQTRFWERVPGMLLGTKGIPTGGDLPVFVQLLIANGNISQEEFTQLSRGSKLTPLALEPLLLPVVGKDNLLAALATHYGVTGVDLEAADISPQVALVVPQEVGVHQHVACIDINERGMTLAMVDPHDEKAVSSAETKTDFRVARRSVVLNSDLKTFQDLLYGTPRSLKISPRDVVDDILRMAIEQEASDVHIEPLEDEIQIRFRKDGVLIKSFDIREIAPKKLIVRHLKTAIPVVIKNKSGASGKTMNIAENQKPQDGRIYLAGRGLDLRVSILPSVHGESIVIRIHRSREDAVDFKKLGFSDRNIKAFLHIIQAPYGIMLVSGPTGSGKTTTLYHVLRHLNSPEKKIVTIEDPVECMIPSVVQVQTNPAKGVSFAEALRSFLRHDPDIIMVGEIRDKETALMAVEASLTGHLVLSSIHANDAVRTITRIKDLGVNPLLVSSTCLGTLAQRLVRLNCTHCRQKARFSNRFYRLLERHGVYYTRDSLSQSAGCSRCNFTGYHGRTGIFELMVLTSEIREAILNQVPDAELEQLARQQGMRLLIEDALSKAAQGLTTEAEVLRVTLSDTTTDELALDAPPQKPRTWRQEESKLERYPAPGFADSQREADGDARKRGRPAGAPPAEPETGPTPADEALDTPPASFPEAADDKPAEAVQPPVVAPDAAASPLPPSPPREPAGVNRERSRSRSLAKDSVGGARRVRRGL